MILLVKLLRTKCQNTMNGRNNKIDFSTVLASAVHDMKNSLTLMIQSIEELESTLKEHNVGIDKAASIHYQAARLNTGLMQLLSLYRAQLNDFPLNIDEHYIEDVLDDVVASNQNHISTRDIAVSVEQDPDLYWYFDEALVDVLLNDMMVNAMRYGKHELKVSAFEKDDRLHIVIEDDGPGFPESMLAINNIGLNELDLSSGRTGLGLFFARLIAEAHTIDDKKGIIRLENGGSLGGGVFTLILP